MLEQRDAPGVSRAIEHCSDYRGRVSNNGHFGRAHHYDAATDDHDNGSTDDHHDRKADDNDHGGARNHQSRSGSAEGAELPKKQPVLS